MSEDETRKQHLIEALYQAMDLAKSGKSLDPEFITEFQRVYPKLDMEKAIPKLIGQRVKGIEIIIKKLEHGDNLQTILQTEEAGTGILLYEQKAIHSLRIAGMKENLVDVKVKLRILNGLRIQFVRGSEDDPISQTVRELTRE